MHKLQHDIERYLKGEMTPAEMHLREKQSLSDPFLADALEGGMSIEAAEFSSDLKSIQSALVVAEQTPTITLSPLRVAASVALLLAAVYGVYHFMVFNIAPVTTAAVETKSPDTTTNSLAQKPPLAAAKVRPDLLAVDKAAAAPPTTSSSLTEQSATAVDSLLVSLAVTDTQAEALAKEEVMTLHDSIPAEVLKVVAEESSNSQLPATESSDAKRMATPAMAGASPMQSSVTDNGIQGVVTIADNVRAASGIDITLKGTSISTHTDEAGHFRLPFGRRQGSLVFSAPGLETTEVDAYDQSINVEMSTPGSAGEIVVSGSPSTDAKKYDRNNPDLVYAMPVDGARAFNRYLIRSLRYPDEAIANRIQGNVLIEFTVKSDSTLTDYKILRGIGYGCDEELVRLVYEGPKWLPLYQENVPYDSQVKVRLKFILPKQ